MVPHIDNEDNMRHNSEYAECYYENELGVYWGTKKMRVFHVIFNKIPRDF